MNEKIKDRYQEITPLFDDFFTKKKFDDTTTKEAVEDFLTAFYESMPYNFGSEKFDSILALAALSLNAKYYFQLAKPIEQKSLDYFLEVIKYQPINEFTDLRQYRALRALAKEYVVMLNDENKLELVAAFNKTKLKNYSHIKLYDYAVNATKRSAFDSHVAKAKAAAAEQPDDLDKSDHGNDTDLENSEEQENALLKSNDSTNEDIKSENEDYAVKHTSAAKQFSQLKRNSTLRTVRSFFISVALLISMSLMAAAATYFLIGSTALFLPVMVGMLATSALVAMGITAFHLFVNSRFTLNPLGRKNKTTGKTLPLLLFRFLSHFFPRSTRMRLLTLGAITAITGLLAAAIVLGLPMLSLPIPLGILGNLGMLNFAIAAGVAIALTVGLTLLMRTLEFMFVKETSQYAITDIVLNAKDITDNSSDDTNQKALTVLENMSTTKFGLTKGKRNTADNSREYQIMTYPKHTTRKWPLLYKKSKPVC